LSKPGLKILSGVLMHWPTLWPQSCVVLRSIPASTPQFCVEAQCPVTEGISGRFSKSPAPIQYNKI
jgi:hypothetical protein